MRLERLLRSSFVAFSLLALGAVAFAATDSDDDEAPVAKGGLPTLNAEQLRAAGIMIAHPLNAELAQRDEAIGLVLDPVDLIAAAAEADAAAAGSRAASAEVERARGLYHAGTGASLKTVQSAEADQAHSHAQAETAAAKLTAHWRPVAMMPAGARQKLFDDLRGGSVLLVRADLPGRHVLGSLPDRALLEVDGIGVPGKVLGALAPRSEEVQGAGLLIEVRNAPAGLGSGARVPVTLLGGKHSGVLVSRDAVLYDDGGAFVYKQLGAKAGDKAARYNPVRVKLLQAHGDSWLVDGIDDDDNIVVHGAGVLWSLQGLVGHAAGDMDDGD
jgi:hypothetical protein